MCHKGSPHRAHTHTLLLQTHNYDLRQLSAGHHGTAVHIHVCEHIHTCTYSYVKCKTGMSGMSWHRTKLISENYNTPRKHAVSSKWQEVTHFSPLSTCQNSQNSVYEIRSHPDLFRVSLWFWFLTVMCFQQISRSCCYVITHLTIARSFLCFFKKLITLSVQKWKKPMTTKPHLYPITQAWWEQKNKWHPSVDDSFIKLKLTSHDFKDVDEWGSSLKS